MTSSTVEKHTEIKAKWSLKTVQLEPGPDLALLLCLLYLALSLDHCSYSNTLKTSRHSSLTFFFTQTKKFRESQPNKFVINTKCFCLVISVKV